MSNKILLTCKNCEVKFEKIKKEVTRQEKRGRSNDHWFCSRRCDTIHKNKNRTPETQKKISDALSKRNKGNTYSKKGQFTYYLNKSKNRKYGCNLTEEYLQQIWEKQEQKCAYTGILLSLHGVVKRSPTTASLDRIDSSKGYEKGNVHFICYSLNLAKNDFDHDTFTHFLSMIHQTQPVYLQE